MILFGFLSMLLCCDHSQAFLSIPHFCCQRIVGCRPRFPLYSGRGVAPDYYSWREEAFEIELSVTVPKHTRAKDIQFKATSNSIDLRLKREGSDEDSVVLLDPNRPLRGKVNVEGTYWVLEDADDDGSSSDDDDRRRVTVTIEKLISTPRDDFEVIDYDWKGVYQQDSEVTERTYDEPEKLNVREYAASLGVDIDNLNMSMVDKTMFTSGLNLTQSSLNQLSKAGFVQEVTSQRDGDYAQDETGQVSKVNTYGSGVDGDEIQRATKNKLPFIDVDTTAWKAAVTVNRDPETNRTYVQQTRNFTRAAFAEDASQPGDVPASTGRQPGGSSDVTDPIDLLTVKRLREILKSQGLKVTGSKEELQARLRQQVNSLLQGKHD